MGRAEEFEGGCDGVTVRGQPMCPAEMVSGNGVRDNIGRVSRLCCHVEIVPDTISVSRLGATISYTRTRPLAASANATRAAS